MDKLDGLTDAVGCYIEMAHPTALANDIISEALLSSREHLIQTYYTDEVKDSFLYCRVLPYLRKKRAMTTLFETLEMKFTQEMPYYIMHC